MITSEVIGDMLIITVGDESLEIPLWLVQQDWQVFDERPTSPDDPNAHS